MSDKKIILEADGIFKSFGKNEVLKGIHFELEEGEVHALIGENGAGKSTLLKILFGIYHPTAGTILMNGEQVYFKNPIDAIHHGIAMIHQEPSVFEDLSIAENIFTGHCKKAYMDWKDMEGKASQLMERVGLHYSPKRKMRGLSVAEQQLVEIAAALASDAKIIFMDEPTASLTPNEVDNLLNMIRRLRQEGKTIVYISHRLEEIKAVCDRISVMRDGNMIATSPNEEMSKNEMIQLMVGRTLHDRSDRKETIQGEVILEAKDIGIPGIFRNVSFKIHKGEILGMFGLMGAGRTEVARGLFGITPIQQGALLIREKEVKIHSPKDAIGQKIALVPEDRQGLGLFLTKSISFNSTFAIPGKITSRCAWVDGKKEKQIAERYAEEFSTKYADINQKVGDLSGGNQQKVSLAKWISTEPDILILDEPTRGIDVGAKEEVYKIIQELAENGKCIIMISSEISEIMRLSNRVLVMYEGAQTAILSGDEMTETGVLAAAHNQKVDRQGEVRE